MSQRIYLVRRGYRRCEEWVKRRNNYTTIPLVQVWERATFICYCCFVTSYYSLILSFADCFLTSIHPSVLLIFTLVSYFTFCTPTFHRQSTARIISGVFGTTEKTSAAAVDRNEKKKKKLTSMDACPSTMANFNQRSCLIYRHQTIWIDPVFLCI